MRLFQSFLPFFILLIIVSCKKDEAIVEADAATDNLTNVTQALQPYFEEFEYQASLRGLDVDLTAANIIGKIEELSDENVAGQCTYGSHIDNEVTIDESFWNDYPYYYIREMVVFHELGHCYLDRGHREGAHSNGTCISIMRSGLENCHDNYNSQTRTSYLNELFSTQ